MLLWVFFGFNNINFESSEALHIVNFIKDPKMIKIIYQTDKRLLNFAYRDVKTQYPFMFYPTIFVKAS